MYKMLVQPYSIYFFLLKNMKTGLGLWMLVYRIMAWDRCLPQSWQAGVGAQGLMAVLAFPNFTVMTGAVSYFQKALAVVSTWL